MTNDTMTYAQLVDWINAQEIIRVQYKGNAQPGSAIQYLGPESVVFNPDAITAIWESGGAPNVETHDSVTYLDSASRELWIYPCDSETDSEEAASSFGEINEYYVFDHITTEGSDRIASEEEFEAFVASDREVGGTWCWALVEHIVYDGETVERNIIGFSAPDAA